MTTAADRGPRPSGAASWIAVAVLLFVLLDGSPGATAQAVPAPVTTAVVGFSLVCDHSLFQVDFLGSTTGTCQLYDLSRDAVYQVPGSAGAGGTQHETLITATPRQGHGFVVTVGPSPVFTYGGDIRPVQIIVQTTPLVDEQDFPFDVNVNYTGPGGIVSNQTLHMIAQVNPFDIAHVDLLDVLQNAGQFQVVSYHIQVTNDGVFPDVYGLTVNAPDGFETGAPPSLYVPPHQAANFTISTLTPHDSLYEWGRTVTFDFRVISTRGTGVYPVVGILNLSGPYVPSYWVPLTLVGLAGLVVVTRKGSDRLERRRLESGRPRRVEPTPRQAVLLRELKRRDPGAFRERRAQLVALYAERRAAWKVARGEQRVRDREERRVARQEFKAQKRKRRAELAAARRQRKADQAAADRAAKADAREAKRKGKQLSRTRKKLDKARAKQAARDAKAQAAAERRAAKEARTAAKAEKKARKGAK
jgi:hypothetical protein